MTVAVTFAAKTSPVSPRQGSEDEEEERGFGENLGGGFGEGV